MTDSSSAPPAAELAKSVEEVARYWHADPYYDRAEQADWLDGFWDPNLPFLPLFDMLNIRCLAELACGHGRHAGRIHTRVPAYILIDVVDENVEFCRNRFAGEKNVAVLKNDGCTFRPLPDSSLTAIFCYDAMVHFEFDVVLSYIQDTARVLEPGGRALYHHSMLSAFPGRDHRKNPGGRNFMSLEIFKHVATNAGLKVVRQMAIDWNDPHTDALTLLEKP